MSKTNRSIPDPKIKEQKANNKNISQDINNISSNIDENTKAINSLINYLPSDILLQVLPDFLAINDTTNKISTDSKISQEEEHQIFPNQNEFKNEDESQNSTLDNQQLQRQNNPSNNYTNVIDLISSIVNNNTILINSLINTIPPEFLPDMPDLKLIQNQIPKNISGTPQKPQTNSSNNTQKEKPNLSQPQISNQETKKSSNEKNLQLTSRSISNRQIVFFPSNDIYPKGIDINKQDKRPKLLLKSENSKNKKYTISNHKKIQFLSFSNKKPQNKTNKTSSSFTLVTSVLSEPTSNSSETIEITEFSLSKIFIIANIYTLNFSNTIQITDNLPYQLSGIIGIVDIIDNEFVSQKVESKENCEKISQESKIESKTEEEENIESKMIVENDEDIEDKITVENDDEVEFAEKTEEDEIIQKNDENVDDKIVTENTKKMFEETENEIIKSIQNIKTKEVEGENLTITENIDIKIEKDEDENLDNEVMQNDIKVVLEEEEETSDVELNTQNVDENISKIKDETDQTIHNQTIVIEEEEEVDEINQMSSNSEENKIDQITTENSNNSKNDEENEEVNNSNLQITEISYSNNSNNDNDKDNEIEVQINYSRQIREQNCSEDGSENQNNRIIQITENNLDDNEDNLEIRNRQITENNLDDNEDSLDIRNRQITEQNYSEDGSENNRIIQITENNFNDDSDGSINRQIVPLHNVDDPNNFQMVSRQSHHFDDDNGQHSIFQETRNSVVVSHHENGGSRHQKRTIVSITQERHEHHQTTQKMSSNFFGGDQKQQIVHDDDQNALNQLMKMVDGEDVGQTFDSNFLATHGFDVSNFKGANGSNMKVTIERTQTTNRSYSNSTVHRQKRKVTMNDTQLLTFDSNGNYIE